MLKKVTSIIYYVFLALSAIIGVVLIYNSGNVDSDAVFEIQLDQIGSSLEYSMIWTYILGGLCAITAIVFPIIFLFTNPKLAVKSLIVLAGFVVIYFISRGLASDEIMQFVGSDKLFYGDDLIINDETTAKAKEFSLAVGTGLKLTYIVGALAVGSMVYTEVAKIFK